MFVSLVACYPVWSGCQVASISGATINASKKEALPELGRAFLFLSSGDIRAGP